MEEEKDPKGRLLFLQVVLDLLCNVDRDYRLLITIKDLSEHMMNLNPLLPANIYRKAHGNLAALLKRKDFKNILHTDGNVVTLLTIEKLKIALSSNSLTEKQYEECVVAWVKSKTQARSILYSSNMNVCKRFFIIILSLK